MIMKAVQCIPRWAEYHARGSMVTWVSVCYKHSLTPVLKDWHQCL